MIRILALIRTVRSIRVILNSLTKREQPKKTKDDEDN
jgi:hypothetical protein